MTRPTLSRHQRRALIAWCEEVRIRRLWDAIFRRWDSLFRRLDDSACYGRRPPEEPR